jgi:hypothetical protein
MLDDRLSSRSEWQMLLVRKVSRDVQSSTERRDSHTAGTARLSGVVSDVFNDPPFVGQAHRQGVSDPVKTLRNERNILAIQGCQTRLAYNAPWEVVKQAMPVTVGN